MPGLRELASCSYHGLLALSGGGADGEMADPTLPGRDWGHLPQRTQVSASGEAKTGTANNPETGCPGFCQCES